MIFVLIAVVLLAMLFLWRVARGQSAPVQEVRELEGRVLQVDLAAFRNLIDPAQDEFLRARLSAAQFRSTRRQRRLAAIDYVSRTSHNAAILLRLGEAAQKSGDATIAAAGEQLVSAALATRIYSLLALSELYVEVLLPGVSFSPAQVADQYERLRASLGRLGYLQQPAAAHLYSAV